MTLDELYEIFIEDKKIDIIQATVETNQTGGIFHA